MSLDSTHCYRALQARDARFDGVFFVAVTTTGIYCRPICPVRVPSAERCLFFMRAAEAERAGYRACFRCRPELAPGHFELDASARTSVDALESVARAASIRIEAGYLNRASVDELASELGVTARHLRRAMEATLGVTPIELAQTKRLALAKHLLHESTLPLTEVAFAAGFTSVRRFNATFQSRFGRPPRAIRRERSHAPVDPHDAEAAIALRLDYRPPLEWNALLAFLEGRSVPGVEQVKGGEYRRSVTLDGRAGWVAVRSDGTRDALRAHVSLSLAPVLSEVIVRLRALFDLDARPNVIAEHLRSDPVLARSVAVRPGLRVPGAFDAFETALRAILGQQVSVAAARTLTGRLVARFGLPPAFERGAKTSEVGWQFPSAERLADATVDAIASIGMPGSRAKTILRLSRAVASGDVCLDWGVSPEACIEQLVSLPGIGPWTAHYIALRALRWPNAFPSADLGVHRALGVTTANDAEERAKAWEPWRAYAVLHLWTPFSSGEPS